MILQKAKDYINSKSLKKIYLIKIHDFNIEFLYFRINKNTNMYGIGYYNYGSTFESFLFNMLLEKPYQGNFTFTDNDIFLMHQAITAKYNSITSQEWLSFFIKHNLIEIH